MHADHFPRGIRGELKWQIQKLLIKKVAKNIITDSHASKHDIQQVLGFSPEHVFLIPLAPRVVFKPNKLSEVRKKYKLNNKYVLYVGDVNWNKNIPGLLDSVSNLPLVCVGKAFVDYQTEMPKNVKKLGFVSDEELAGLYSMAEVLVYPSYAEGFGFPVLEAMACGCPVVTSNVSSLVEIAGPAIMVNPYKPDDIRRGIDLALGLSASARHDMVASGFEWVKKFTWKKTAHATAKIYEKTINNYTRI